MNILRKILEEKYMSQVQEIRESRIAKVMEGIGMFFKALSVNENAVKEPEEEVKESGIKELINSSERIKKMEAIFEEKGTSIKQVKAKLNVEEKNTAPIVKNPILNTKNIEKEEEDLER